MIAVYTPPQVRVPELSGSTFMGFPLLHFSDWARFERGRLRTGCAILVIPHLTRARALQHLHGSRHRGAQHPTILVTERDADALRSVVGAPVQEVVWLEEVASGLRQAVRRAQASGYLAGVASRLTTSAHIPPQLREALAFACQAPEPVATVAAMAQAAGCSRCTLSRQWKQVLPDRPGLRIQDFLDHVLLHRAASRRTPDRSWAAVCAELRVQERTLRRIMRRVMGGQLRQLDDSALPALAARFSETVLDALAPDATN